MPRTSYMGILMAALALGAILGVAGESAASCPSTLAGFMETTPLDLPFNPYETFEWYNYFGERSFVAGDTVTVDFAIVPMEGVWTSVGLDGIGGPTFFALNFDGAGSVQALVPGDPIATYLLLSWNDVRATIRFATQDVLLDLNGESFGPFSFGLTSMTAQAFRVNGGMRGPPGSGWIDEVRVMSSSTGVLFEEDFDQGRVFDLYQGRLTAATPPPGPTRPPSCDESFDAGKVDPPSVAPVLVIWGLGAIPLARSYHVRQWRAL